MTERYKINEIFYSLQGEGFHTGTAAVFIRFSGCNLKCDFCDTQHLDGVFLSIDEIIHKVKSFKNAPLIILTGGEPSLFITSEFVEKLKHETGMKIAIETNGTCTLPSNIDWVTLSPKGKFKGGDIYSLVLNSCDELKVVYCGQPLDEYFMINATHRFLQPCGSDNPEIDRKITQDTIDIILKDPRWRLSLQTHKILSIR